LGLLLFIYLKPKEETNNIATHEETHYVKMAK